MSFATSGGFAPGTAVVGGAANFGPGAGSLRSVAGGFGSATSFAGFGGGISALAGLGSSIVGAISTYNAGKAQRDYSRRQAAQAAKIGRMNAATVAINRRKLIGAQRAAFAASGVVASSGSPLDLMIDNFILGIADEARALSDASYRVQDVRARGENEFRAGQASAIRQGFSGITTATTRGLFSIKSNPLVTDVQTVLGGN
jgi:hypothetical protein